MRIRITPLLLLVFLAPATVWAQAETGRITGRVVDAQGAAVSGAMVTATNTETRVSRTTMTARDGSYVIPNLLPAPYEIKIEMSGFAPLTRTIQMTVGAIANVDVSLKLGGVAETVQVTAAEESLVNVRNAEVATTINEQQLRELPTLTRDPFDLVALAGAASEDIGGEKDDARGAGFALNGLRSTGTNILLDGTANNNEFSGDEGQSIPLDAVQEFSVITSNFSPQYGRATAGVVNLVVKSGTNTFRGSGYEYFRNEKLSTNSFENKARGNEKDPFDRHQFGASAGGPIVRDKVFFFGSVERIRVRSNDTFTQWVATPEFLAQTSAATQAFFSPHQLATPINGPVITRGEIGGTPGGPFAALPAGLPVFAQVSRSFPADAGGGDPQNTTLLVGRVDYALSPTTQIYGRYALEKSDFFAGSNTNSPYAGFDTGAAEENHNFLVSLTNVWSSRFTTQSKVTINRLNEAQPLGEQPAGPTLYMRNAPVSLRNVPIAFPGYLPFNPGVAIPFGGPQNFLQLYQDGTFLSGSHEFRFGGSYTYIRDNREFGAFENSVQTLGTTNNQAFDNLVIGKLAQFQGAIDPQGKFPGETVTLPVSQPAFARNNRYHEWATYFSDAWSIKPRLTVNLGLRYEYFGVQHNSDPSLDSNFYYGAGSNLFERIRSGSIQQAPNSPVGGLWRPDRNNFAPRIGFAWDVNGDGRTSLRGGYGIGYERNFGNVTFNVIQNPPAYSTISIVAGTDVPSIDISTDNAGPLAGSGTTKVLPTSSARHVDEDIVNAYAHFWSLSVQHQFAPGVAASIDYLGSRGQDLYTLTDPNAPGAGAVYLGDTVLTRRLNLQYSNLNTRSNLGKSLYNGLVFGFDARRLGTTGLSASARYTLGYAKDNNSSTFTTDSNNASTNTGLLDPFDPDLDYGWAEFDVRHRLTVGAIWQIPYGRGRGGLFESLAGGWQLSGVFTARSGSPFTVFDCTQSVAGYARCPRMLEVAALPDGASKPVSTGDANTFVYMDLSNQVAGAGTYVNPVTGTGIFGPFPSNMTKRNAFRQPGLWNVDAILAKRFAMNGRAGVQIRIEAYNLLNHANLFIRQSETDISTAEDTDGDNIPDQFRILSFRGDTGDDDGAPEGDGQRRLQIGLRFDF
jgi:hypothetical protein